MYIPNVRDGLGTGLGQAEVVALMEPRRVMLISCSLPSGTSTASFPSLS